MRKLTLSLVAALACAALPMSAHELWIAPLNYQVPAGANIQAHIVNGQDFEGTTLPYITSRFQHFVAFTDGQGRQVAGRNGDVPAMDRATDTEGLHVIAYQSTPSTIGYDDWAKFQKFVDHKDFGDVRTTHDARGLPETGFKENYIRYSKSLIGVGNAAGSDLRAGLETELVALMNPYTDDLSNGFRVQLFYGQDVRANEQVEIFDQPPGGDVIVSTVRTDADGIATIPVTAGHIYMLDAVVLREPSDAVAEATGTVWETLWANMTFAVPE